APRSTLFPYTTLFRSVELAARAGGTRDHQPPVPFGGQAQEEARLSERVRRDARVELDSSHRLGNRRAIGRLGRDDATVGDWRERSEEHTSELQSPDHL